MASSALGASQVIQYLPAGSMVDYAGTSAPAGWLMCDGKSLPVSSYPDLFASIGYSYGGSGANFNLPDFRGRFARYNDNMGTSAGAAGRDTGRNHGSTQDQSTGKNGLSFTSVNHSSSGSTSAGSASSWNTMVTGAGENIANWDGHSLRRGTQVTGASGDGSYPGKDHTHSVSVSGTISASTLNSSFSGDAETRPINVSCNRIIKY
jgi:microcystin-dependent protein